MIEPRKYRKKPVVIEAMEITAENGQAIKEWSQGATRPEIYGSQFRICINTREGTIFGFPGDFIIKGIEGEFYPCGGDIFRKTYDEV